MCWIFALASLGQLCEKRLKRIKMSGAAAARIAGEVYGIIGGPFWIRLL